MNKRLIYDLEVKRVIDYGIHSHLRRKTIILQMLDAVIGFLIISAFAVMVIFLMSLIV